MSESANRYFLIMFLRKEKKTFLSKEESISFIEEYNKNNRKPGNPEVCGNLKTELKSESNSGVFEYSVYRKITLPTTLEVIDYNICEKYHNEKELKTRYANDVRGGKGKLYIGYMYNGEVKTLPIFYIKDKLYVNYEALTDFIIDNSLNEEFIATLWSSPGLKNLQYKKNSIYFMKKIMESYGNYIAEKGSIEDIHENIRLFMKAYCTHDDKINQRLVREIGLIVKNALKKIDKKTIKKKDITRKLTLF